MIPVVIAMIAGGLVCLLVGPGLIIRTLSAHVNRGTAMAFHEVVKGFARWISFSLGIWCAWPLTGLFIKDSTWRIVVAIPVSLVTCFVVGIVGSLVITLVLTLLLHPVYWVLGRLDPRPF